MSKESQANQLRTRLIGLPPEAIDDLHLLFTNDWTDKLVRHECVDTIVEIIYPEILGDLKIVKPYQQR